MLVTDTLEGVRMEGYGKREEGNERAYVRV